MNTEKKRNMKTKGGGLSGEKLLADVLYVVTTLCVLWLILQSIASMFMTK